MFERIDPPPGGVEALRVRLRRDVARRHARRRLALATVALALPGAVAALLALRPAPPPDALAEALRPARQRLGLLPPPADPLSVPAGSRSTLAMSRVPLPTDAVLLYFAGSLED